MLQAIALGDLQTLDGDADPERPTKVIRDTLGKLLLGVVHGSVARVGANVRVIVSSIQRAGSGSIAARSGEA